VDVLGNAVGSAPPQVALLCFGAAKTASRTLPARTFRRASGARPARERTPTRSASSRGHGTERRRREGWTTLRVPVPDRPAPVKPAAAPRPTLDEVGTVAHLPAADTGCPMMSGVKPPAGSDAAPGAPVPRGMAWLARPARPRPCLAPLLRRGRGLSPGHGMVHGSMSPLTAGAGPDRGRHLHMPAPPPAPAMSA
jgi:hypothetical protein